MQKIRKILRAVSEKTALPTKQLFPTTPILQDLADAGPKNAKISVRVSADRHLWYDVWFPTAAFSINFLGKFLILNFPKMQK